jgi:hypothetical protein
MKKKMKKKAKKVSKKRGGRRSESNGDVRSLTKVSGGASYAITLPRDVIKSFKWKERQKLKLQVDEKKKTILIRDWK